MVYLKLVLEDTLGFWDDYLADYAFNPQQSKTITTWYRLPEEWFDQDGLREDRREVLLQNMYGPTWRMGNGDGSKYVVLSLKEERLGADEVAQRLWSDGGGSCYALEENGKLAKVDPAVF